MKPTRTIFSMFHMPFLSINQYRRHRLILSLFYLLLTCFNVIAFASARADDLKGIIQQFKKENGHALSEDEFVDILAKHKVQSQEMLQYITVVKQQQKPEISCDQLSALFQARQNSINNIKMEWRHMIEDKRHNVFSDSTYTFVLSNEKVLLDMTPNNKKSAEANLKRIASYDGEVLRLVDIPIENSTSDSTNAFISKFESYESHFIFPDNILWITMLLNSDKYGHSDNLASNIVKVLNDKVVIVYEQHQKFFGVDCVVVSNGVFRIYLDPKNSYTVVGLESYLPNEVKENGIRYIRGINLRQRRILTDLKNYGNDLFLPSKIVSEIYSKTDGTLEICETIDVHSIEVNKGKYDKCYFSDVIPDDAMVADGINNLVYKQSDSASIGDLLKGVAKSKRVFIYRYISVISGLVLIVIVLAIKYRQYRKNKRDNENKTEEKK